MFSNLAHDENPQLIPNMLHQRKHLIKLSFLFGKRNCKATYTMKFQQALSIFCTKIHTFELSSRTRSNSLLNFEHFFFVSTSNRRSLVLWHDESAATWPKRLPHFLPKTTNLKQNFKLRALLNSHAPLRKRTNKTKILKFKVYIIAEREADSRIG